MRCSRGSCKNDVLDVDSDFCPICTEKTIEATRKKIDEYSINYLCDICGITMKVAYDTEEGRMCYDCRYNV